MHIRVHMLMGGCMYILLSPQPCLHTFHNQKCHPYIYYPVLCTTWPYRENMPREHGYVKYITA